MIFVGRDLNKALIRYLENRLVEIARDSKSYVVLTKNTYKNTVMKESQVAVMEEFIENVKILISTLGYKVLLPAPQATYHLFVLQRIRCKCKRLCQCRRIYRTEGFDRFGSYRSIVGDKRKNILQSEK